MRDRKSTGIPDMICATHERVDWSTNRWGFRHQKLQDELREPLGVQQTPGQIVLNNLPPAAASRLVSMRF